MAEELPTPIFMAVMYGSLEMTKQILEKDQDVINLNWSGFRPLHLAIEVGHANIVKELLKQGADIAFRTPIENGSLTPLLYAADKCNSATIQELLCHGACIEDTDVQGNTALGAAASEDQASVVALLLS